MEQYHLIRTNRRTLALSVKEDGSLEVRAPQKISKAYIEDFIRQKKNWIESTRQRIEGYHQSKRVITLSSQEETIWMKKALVMLEQKCEFFAKQMDVAYSTVKVNRAKSRWGSCNGRGNINFTYRLAFAPEPLVDYVVIHELAHTKELNHSSAFWKVVKDQIPDYKERRKMLAEFQHSTEFHVESI